LLQRLEGGSEQALQVLHVVTGLQARRVVFPSREPVLTKQRCELQVIALSRLIDGMHTLACVRFVGGFSA